MNLPFPDKEPARRVGPPDDPHDGQQAGPKQLLLTARQAAQMCAKSLRTWRSWDAGGLIPRPV